MPAFRSKFILRPAWNACYFAAAWNACYFAARLECMLFCGSPRLIMTLFFGNAPHLSVWPDTFFSYSLWYFVFSVLKKNDVSEGGKRWGVKFEPQLICFSLYFYSKWGGWWASGR
ncbi:MAG: hypothetical protein DRR16_08820 [Candidatus Parabeggiatoa sp. nov. 3]|nr:MAG: hypothetical protein DRQ99_02855 [Gammaproteobacteria bacterium]RKZ86798.1 MAG: hypothetical protein DRR16_08820 [Gammaproteobacteria bacterium]